VTQVGGDVTGDINVNVYNSSGSAITAVHTLPVDIACFTGRRAELDYLLGEIDAAMAGGRVLEISAIDGTAGIGKTALTVHAGHRLAASSPMGRSSCGCMAIRAASIRSHR
jgi:hypothetical protein